MFRRIKNLILKLLHSKKFFEVSWIFGLQLYVLNKLIGTKNGIFKIKKIADLVPATKIFEGYRYLSKTQNNIEVTVPDLNLYIIKDAVINSRSSALIKGKSIYYESINDNERFNEGFVKYHSKKNALIDLKDTDCLNDGFFLAGNGSHNWYHWLIEILPKMLYYKKDYSRNILVDQSCKDIPSMAETLQTLVENYDVNIIYLDPLKRYRIKKLYFINEVNKLMYNELNRELASQPVYYYRKESLKELSEILKDKYLTDSISCKPKIYLRRQNTHRTASNEKELAELLSDYQFSFIDLAKCSIQRQVEVLSKAKHIVGTSGAAFTNILFCSPNTKIVIFMPDNYMSYQFYKEMGEFLQLDVVYLYYENGNNTHEDCSFSVDREKLHQLIEIHG